MPAKRFSSRAIRARSRIIGKGEQGEVREIRKNPFGKSRGEVVKIGHTTALYRPLTYFNTWLVEPREFDTKKRIILTQIVHNIANVLFPDNVVNIPLTRFPQEPGKYHRNLDYLDKDEILPELYMPKVEEPEELQRLKKKFYHASKEKQNRETKTDLEGRQKIFVETIESRLKFDAKVRELFPQIIDLEKQIEEAGFDIQHPEINFGFRNGRVVFYDLFPRLNIVKLFTYLQKANLTEKQRRAVQRLLKSLARLNLSKTDLWDRRKTYFESLTTTGQKILSRIFETIPQNQNELHGLCFKAFEEDFTTDGKLRPDVLLRFVVSLNKTKTVKMGNRTYTAKLKGDKLMVFLDIPEKMFGEMITTDIGLPVIEISLSIDKNNGKISSFDFTKAQIKVLDIQYLIDNKLIPEDQIKLMYA